MNAESRRSTGARREPRRMLSLVIQMPFLFAFYSMLESHSNCASAVLGCTTVIA